MFLLKPKKLKYEKNYEKKFPYNSCKIEVLNFGKYGIIAKTGGNITSKQIETIRRILTRFFKKKGKIWIKVFPRYGITKKPLTSRMGKGKGTVKYWVSKIRKGKILFEFDCLGVYDFSYIIYLINCRVSFSVKLVKN